MTPAWYAALCAERNAAEHELAQPPCLCDACTRAWQVGMAARFRASQEAAPPARTPSLPAPDGYWEALCEPLGLAGRDLDRLVPPGGCRSCHCGPVPPGQPSGLCLYCEALTGLKTAAALAGPVRHPDGSLCRAGETARRKRVRAFALGIDPGRFILAWAGVILLALAAEHGWPVTLAVPGLVLVLIAGLFARSDR